VSTGAGAGVFDVFLQENDAEIKTRRIIKCDLFMIMVFKAHNFNI